MTTKMFDPGGGLGIILYKTYIFEEKLMPRLYAYFDSHETCYLDTVAQIIEEPFFFLDHLESIITTYEETL